MHLILSKPLECYLCQCSCSEYIYNVYILYWLHMLLILISMNHLWGVALWNFILAGCELVKFHETTITIW